MKKFNIYYKNIKKEEQSMNHFNKKQKIIAIILITIIGIGIYCYTDAIENTNEEEIENVLEVAQTNTTKETEEKNIFVHIAGCVQKEGMLELSSNSRIADAIEKAGGLTQEADLSDINLAYLLEDGMKIYIPNQNERQENNEKTENIPKAENTPSMQIQDTNTKQDVININTATQEELDTLPGIGPATAAKIIAYRKEKGKFKQKEEIKEVSGIGEAKYEKIKEYISIK